MYFDLIWCYVSYASYCVTINTGVFPGKMCLDHHKNHGYGQKKPEATSSARFGIRTPAKYCELKCCVLTEFAAEPTTNLKSSKANFVTWTFHLQPKRQLSLLLNFFFPLLKLFLTFVVSAKTQTGVLRKFLWTDGRSRHTRISWLDRLRNLLSNGATCAGSAMIRSRPWWPG